jgi:hypothetical protein
MGIDNLHDNPAKGSYSIAPTLAICAVGRMAYSTVLSERSPRRLMQAALIGFLVGLSVNLRIANHFLASGTALSF